VPNRAFGYVGSRVLAVLFVTAFIRKEPLRASVRCPQDRAASQDVAGLFRSRRSLGVADTHLFGLLLLHSFLVSDERLHEFTRFLFARSLGRLELLAHQDHLGGPPMPRP
jgi:hypothetical protein